MKLEKLYKVFGGTTEFYAFIFTVVAIILAFKNLLTGSFVGAVSAITTLVTANDIHNDLNVKSTTDVTVQTDDPGGPH